MNNMRITEANQNFTTLTKKVDTESVVGIEKNNVLKYVMLTNERYESIDKNVFFGRKGNELIKVTIGSDQVDICQVYNDNGILAYIIAEAPLAAVKIEIAGDSLKLSADLDSKPEGTRSYAHLGDVALNLMALNESIVKAEFESLVKEDEAKAIQAYGELLGKDNIFEAEVSITMLGKEVGSLIV